ncbi:MAG: hypothetical protein SF339_20590 [Blastocatellia bacterium]|jgi:uncharacterized membrane protein YphA (DoxX/SURF4 family)|nr:hypothetical protein [Blastocatellia bacterium]
MVILGLMLLFMSFVIGIMVLMAVASYSSGKDEQETTPDDADRK